MPVAIVLLLGVLAFAAKTMIAGGSHRESGKNPSASVQPKPGIELPATLEPGSEGTEVLDLQEGLAALGYDVGGADGVYGSATANAVAAFQAAEGLPVDGTLGPETRAALGTVVQTKLQEEAAPIRNGLDAAAQNGAMTAGQASELRSKLDTMIAGAAKIPPAHALYLPVVLRDAGAQSAELTRPRALALLGEVGANLSYLRRHAVPAERVDTEDADRITYRFFPDHGFQFHPLAAFARLNILVTKGKREEAERLAAALVERGIPAGNTLTWEYYFPVNGGPGRWTSALAQAAAARGRRLGSRVWIRRHRDPERAAADHRLAHPLREHHARSGSARLRRPALDRSRQPTPAVRHGVLVAVLARRLARFPRLPHLSRRPAREACGYIRRAGLGDHGKPLARISRRRGLPALGRDRGWLSCLRPPT